MALQIEKWTPPLDAVLVGKADNFIKTRFPKNRIERILFVNPPDGDKSLFRVSTALRRRYPNYPPYGPAVLAEQVRSVGIEPRVLNLNHEILKRCHESGGENFDFEKVWQDLLETEITDFEPDLIGVTCMFTMTHTSLKSVCEFASKFDVPIAIGGVHVTNDIDRVLDDIACADIAFVRESDVALKTFCRVVAKEEGIESLGQVILNDNGDRLSFGQAIQPTVKDIDVIPAYDLVNVADLSTYGVMGNFHGFRAPETRFATCLSNRGCRAQCTFCSVRNFNGKAVRQRSVDSVLDELECLVNDYGIEHIVWLDDDLLKDHNRAVALFNGMVKRNLGLTWDATNGVIAASCNDEIVHAMEASGCLALMMGMESGNPEILKQIKKPGTIKNFLAAAEVFKRYPKIHARVFLMIGFPGETLAMINDTINVAREMDLYWNSITPLQPLPNTPIHDSMVEQGLLQPTANDEVRFQAGGYGKQDEIDQGRRLASQSFEEAFCSIKMDEVPSREQVNDIWFFMNYHLNFHRLFSEDRSQKIEHQFKHLNALSDVISPDHGLALYFIGYLQYKLYGKADAEVVARLSEKLTQSNYWSGRLQAFGLSVEDLRTGDFKNKEIPRILPGQLPEGIRSAEFLSN